MTNKNNVSSTFTFPRYGEIYDVNLEPVVGSEIGKIRPSLIASNNINNEYSNTVTVIPLTSQPSKKVYPFEVRITRGTAGLTLDSRIKVDQIRTIDKRRLLNCRGALPVSKYPEIEQALKIHLNIK